MFLRLTLILLALLSHAPVWADAKSAEGFNKLVEGSKILLMPLDVELFNVTAGGVPEPQAQWTQSASVHIRGALHKLQRQLGHGVQELQEQDEQSRDLVHLHEAVAATVSMNAYGITLPTKGKKLEWELGDSVTELQKKTGADYALFLFVRDYYASSERKAAIVIAALFGVGLVGGVQVGYASLVDLRTGQLVWFNRLIRSTGDLREAEPAQESVIALLEGFPK